jgi:leucyl/phenylalanyl-tRNA---protein transferase
MAFLEPEPTEVRFPTMVDEDGVVAMGEDFRPGTLLQAYRTGIFPWPHKSGRKHVVLWCSPDPRAVFPLDQDIHVSRSMRRAMRGFRVTMNQAFAEVMRLCGETRPEGTWIIPNLMDGYRELHRRGFCHSVEVWRGEHLVGGIYGVSVGRAFAGESMFHLETNASKVAFYTLAKSLKHSGFTLFDVQIPTPHLMSLGCVGLPRERYLAALEAAEPRKTQNVNLFGAGALSS